VESTREEFVPVVDALLARDEWIMDGNYSFTLDKRLAVADTVIFLDLPRLLCLWRVIKRRIRYRGRSHPGMAEDCPDRITLEFVRWIWSYPRRQRSGMLRRLEDVRSKKQVVILRSPREVARFLEHEPITRFTNHDHRH
jgi:adenylate kinase family enzyme